MWCTAPAELFVFVPAFLVSAFCISSLCHLPVFIALGRPCAYDVFDFSSSLCLYNGLRSLLKNELENIK